MDLRTKYNHAIQTAKSLRMDGAAEERSGKLYFHGVVRSEDEKNEIWNAIKTVPDWQTDIVGDIKVQPQAAATMAAGAGGGSTAVGSTYTVQAGDTLSGIAKHLLGDPSKYPKIFELNRDVLSDPDKIKPGQVLKIPARQ
jgi:nucleoid-associated protein YgaU